MQVERDLGVAGVRDVQRPLTHHLGSLRAHVTGRPHARVPHDRHRDEVAAIDEVGVVESLVRGGVTFEVERPHHVERLRQEEGLCRNDHVAAVPQVNEEIHVLLARRDALEADRPRPLRARPDRERQRHRFTRRAQARARSAGDRRRVHLDGDDGAFLGQPIGDRVPAPAADQLRAWRRVETNWDPRRGGRPDRCWRGARGGAGRGFARAAGDHRGDAEEQCGPGAHRRIVFGVPPRMRA